MLAAFFLAFIVVMFFWLVWKLDHNSDSREAFDPAYRELVKAMKKVEQARRAMVRAEDIEV